MTQNALPYPADAASWRPLTERLDALGAPALLVNAGLSVLLIATAVILSFALSKMAQLLFRRALSALIPDGPAAEAPAPRLMVRLIQIGVWIGAVTFLLALWGVDLSAWGAGAFIADGLRILVVLMLAVAAWEIGGLALAGLLRRAAATAGSARRASQLRSLEPMVRGALRAVVAIFAALIVISQLGVEIGPLLAGAGVVGIAVGFGAQTLVKDYLTGFSLILEDIVSVGDVIRIGDSGGLVETMTLRTIRLRDFDGTLHVIPYSEAQTVHNLTKSFSYYVFNVPISYDSSIDAALALMHAVGAELWREPDFKHAILEPIEVVGVDALADSGVVLKARVKTAPLQQWKVGREYNRRIKLAFDKAGIEIPVPHMKLSFANGALSLPNDE